MKQPPLRIVLVDDHAVVRKGLRSFLSLERDLVVVGEAGTAAEAVALTQRLRPRLILLDIKLPDTSGMEVCRRLLTISPHLRILVLTSYAEDTTVVAALQSGAHGYVLKDVGTDELLRAIRTVAEGHSYLDPRITQQTLHWIRTSWRPESHRQGMARLSPKERLIMPLLAEGKTNKEIAVQLRLSDKTVKNYLANIFEKLHVNRRTEAVAWFVKESQLSPTARNT
jgi:DNA-binding NarL/FixJ family response regulator